ncbi:hypothetical protein O0I10_000897 [Lichtheimia ornata]|uniref:Kinetochore protein SPC25 n=1 Tax=Lichtheimia ornata TaxID=688661 RepID=A0AAD7Y4K7_9FUNG|nr:uncharacterized protein O0I10_000897 [Lichtheimia ornata]KAJ8663649.1 hypothetical protein O0I10_000897 [Lichtheimia ornata]
MKDPTQSLETFHIPVDEVEARIKSASDQLDSFVRTRAAAFASSSSEAQQQSQRHAERVEEQKATIAKYKEQLSQLSQPSRVEELSKRRSEIDALQQTYSTEQGKEAVIHRERDKVYELIQEKKKEAQREPSLDQVRSSCQSELEFVSENLKLRMRGKGGNKVKFTFTCINERDHHRKYSFILHLPPHEPFSVLECVPEVPGLSHILSGLNADRNIYTFITRMRAAFVDLSSKEEDDKI